MQITPLRRNALYDVTCEALLQRLRVVSALLSSNSSSIYFIASAHRITPLTMPINKTVVLLLMVMMIYIYNHKFPPLRTMQFAWLPKLCSAKVVKFSASQLCLLGYQIVTELPLSPCLTRATSCFYLSFELVIQCLDWLSHPPPSPRLPYLVPMLPQFKKL